MDLLILGSLKLAVVNQCWHTSTMSVKQVTFANAFSQCPFCPSLSHICHQYPEKIRYWPEIVGYADYHDYYI